MTSVPYCIRSLLFAPGNESRKVEKLARFGADAIVLDLEDAVAADQKIAARSMVRAALPDLRGPIRCVRVNALSTGLTLGDLEGVVSADLDLIVMPKVESPGDLRTVDALIAAAEVSTGLPRGRIGVIALIETCAGVLAATEIARASPRLVTFVFGSGDLGRDLALPTMRGDISAALAYGRAKVVYDARAAGLPGPLDGPYLAVRDLDGLERDCRAAVALGHRGKVCIHPDQVAVVNRVFGPDPEEVVFAREVIEAFAAAESRGSASIIVNGTFVDYPIVQKAGSIVSLADELAARKASR